MSLAAGATVLALTLGAVAGSIGGWVPGLRALVGGAADVTLAVPWLFLLLAARAALPLEAPPWQSVGLTFLLLGGVGWAAGARVVQAQLGSVRRSDYLLQARACGVGPLRLWWRHGLAQLRPVLQAQFWTLLPGFLLAEANLGFLGLGVSEPLPSWGRLIASLAEGPSVWEAPWLLVPAALLVSVLAALPAAWTGEKVR